MKILTIDRDAGHAICDVELGEIGMLLGFNGWHDMVRTGPTPKAGSEIDLREAGRCGKLIREEKDRLERLRQEYLTRIAELDRLIAFADSRPAVADLEED